MKRIGKNNKSQPPPDLREDRPSPQCIMLSPPSLAASRNVSNDDEVLVSTYNVIVPHKESNVNAWFGRLTTGGSASDQVVAALADAFGVDDTAPKCAGRVQGALTLTSMSPSRSMPGV